MVFYWTTNARENNHSYGGEVWGEKDGSFKEEAPGRSPHGAQPGRRGPRGETLGPSGAGRTTAEMLSWESVQRV